MEVRLYATLRHIAQTRSVDISVESDETVGDVLHRLVARYPRLEEAIWNADGSLAGHVAVVLNGRDVRHLVGVATPVSTDDRLDVFPPVGGGAGPYPEAQIGSSSSISQDRLTNITLRLAGDFRGRLGKHQTRFAFPGNTLRQLMAALVREFDLGDLLMAGDEPRPYVQVVINGRFSYLVGGLEAQIPDGSTVMFFACGGVLTPVPLPPGTTLKHLRPPPRGD